MQEMWDTIKRLNLWIIGIDEGQESQVNDTDQIFRTIIYKKHTEPQLEETRKETPHGISQSKHFEKTFFWTKKKKLKADRENPQFTYKRKPIRIAADSDWEF